MATPTAILTLNAGSSSLKFGLFQVEDAALVRLARGEYRELGARPEFVWRNVVAGRVRRESIDARDHEQAMEHLLGVLPATFPEYTVVAAGHRVVHGGQEFRAPVRLDSAVTDRLRTLVPLAPLHMPHSLAIIGILARLRPGLPQVACFDTAFHHTMPLCEQYFALPRAWYERGVRRYGFHGLSYEYIASVLPGALGREAAEGRVVVAHLGHGASLCALRRRRSQATTMGFTPLDGVPMATRPGHLDPDIPLWLQREAGLAPAEVEHLLNYESGLKGLSGISGDMRQLLADDHPHAAAAVDYFVHHTHRAIASLAAVLGGLDALVFTAGIGENAPSIRARICQDAAWLGIRLDDRANADNRESSSLPDSRVSVWRIPTDEERMIAQHALRLLVRNA